MLSSVKGVGTQYIYHRILQYTNSDKYSGSRWRKYAKHPMLSPVPTLSLTRVLADLCDGWRQTSHQMDRLVKDWSNESWTLGAISKLLHPQSQLVEHRPAVGVPSGAVAETEETIVEQWSHQRGFS